MMCGKFLVFMDNLRLISGKLSNNNNVDFPKLPCQLKRRERDEEVMERDEQRKEGAGIKGIEGLDEGEGEHRIGEISRG